MDAYQQRSIDVSEINENLSFFVEKSRYSYISAWFESKNNWMDEKTKRNKKKIINKGRDAKRKDLINFYVMQILCEMAGHLVYITNIFPWRLKLPAENIALLVHALFIDMWVSRAIIRWVWPTLNRFILCVYLSACTRYRM